MRWVLTLMALGALFWLAHMAGQGIVIGLGRLGTVGEVLAWVVAVGSWLSVRQLTPPLWQNELSDVQFQIRLYPILTVGMVLGWMGTAVMLALLPPIPYSAWGNFFLTPLLIIILIRLQQDLSGNRR